MSKEVLEKIFSLAFHMFFSEILKKSNVYCWDCIDVSSVSSKLLEARSRENERIIFNCTSDSIIKGKSEIRDAITKYNVEDSALKYEVDMLQQSLQSKHVSTDTVLHNIMMQIEYNDHTNRASLSSLI